MKPKCFNILFLVYLTYYIAILFQTSVQLYTAYRKLDTVKCVIYLRFIFSQLPSNCIILHID